MTKRIIYLLAVGLFVVIGCAPQEYVVQHAAKGNFSRSYKHLGVYCDRADIHIHGWSRDSVAIAVTMDAKIKNDYSFLVDSSGDSLLLIGKQGVVTDAGAGSLPQVDIAAPYRTDAVLRTNDGITVDTMSGRIDARAQSMLLYRGVELFSPVDISSTSDIVRIELPSNIFCNVDLKSGENGKIRLDSQNFHGEKEADHAKGTVGSGGMLIKAAGKKGVDLIFR